MDDRFQRARAAVIAADRIPDLADLLAHLRVIADALQPTTAAEDEPWRWAVVEIMGNRKLGGLVREEDYLDGRVLRIDVHVPAMEGPVATQRYPLHAIFREMPATEADARRAGLDFLQRWQCPISTDHLPVGWDAPTFEAWREARRRAAATAAVDAPEPAPDLGALAAELDVEHDVEACPGPACHGECVGIEPPDVDAQPVAVPTPTSALTVDGRYWQSRVFGPAGGVEEQDLLAAMERVFYEDGGPIVAADPPAVETFTTFEIAVVATENQEGNDLELVSVRVCSDGSLVAVPADAARAWAGGEMVGPETRRLVFWPQRLAEILVGDGDLDSPCDTSACDDRSMGWFADVDNPIPF